LEINPDIGISFGKSKLGRNNKTAFQISDSTACDRLENCSMAITSQCQRAGHSSQRLL